MPPGRLLRLPTSRQEQSLLRGRDCHARAWHWSKHRHLHGRGHCRFPAAAVPRAEPVGEDLGEGAAREIRQHGMGGLRGHSGAARHLRGRRGRRWDGLRAAASRWNAGIDCRCVRHVRLVAGVGGPARSGPRIPAGGIRARARSCSGPVARVLAAASRRGSQRSRSDSDHRRQAFHRRRCVASQRAQVRFGLPEAARFC